MINDKVNNLTQTRWNSNRHAHTDLILGNHHKKTLRILTNNLNNRTRYRTGICIITGHIGLNKHLHRINRSDTPNCPNCIDTEETVAHYIGQCPAYSRMRGDTLGTYYGPYAKKGAPSIKELLPKDSEELPKGTS